MRPERDNRAPWQVWADRNRRRKPSEYQGVCWGVYFLYRDWRVIYVGQSTDILKRLRGHERDGRRFDAWCWIPCPPEAGFDTLSRLEAIYITRLQPPENSLSESRKARVMLEIPFQVGPVLDRKEWREQERQLYRSRLVETSFLV